MKAAQAPFWICISLVSAALIVGLVLAIRGGVA